MKNFLFILLFCLAAGYNYTCHAQILDKISEMLDPTKEGDTNELLDLFENPTFLSEEEMSYQFSPHAKCFYLMIKYAIEYEKHVGRINAAANCEEKYDLYGVLLMYIATSTTISYCPEDLLDLFTNLDRAKESRQFRAEIRYMESMAFYYYVATGGGKLNNLNNIIEKLVVDLIITISAYLYEHSGKTSKPISLYRLGSAILDLINEYFHPETIIKTTLEIGEKMDALPCSPGSQYRKN